MPTAEVADERKSRPKAALNFSLMFVDHAAISAGFSPAYLFRRHNR